MRFLYSYNSLILISTSLWYLASAHCVCNSGSSSFQDSLQLLFTFQIYSMSNLDMEGLHVAIKKGDFASLKTLQSDIETTFLHTSDETLTASVANSKLDEVFVATENALTLISSDCQRSLPFNYLRDGKLRHPTMLKVTKAERNNVSVCLDDLGALHVICPLTMMTIKVWDEVKKIFWQPFEIR